MLRIGFGLLWLLDGLLQTQPGMAAGLPSQIIEPGAASSPHWVQHLVNWAGYHLVLPPGASGRGGPVWIQVGIGLGLAGLRRGAGRAAGRPDQCGLGGLVVWVFGESFGGIFAPGLTWLFGAPGAAAVYVVAGAILALPDRAWRPSPTGAARLGRAMLGGLGLVPGRG